MKRAATQINENDSPNQFAFLLFFQPQCDRHYAVESVVIGRELASHVVLTKHPDVPLELQQSVA